VIKRRFWLSAAFLTAMSAMFLVMPWASSVADKTGEWSVRIVGVLFWAFAITGYALLAAANARRKSFLAKRFGSDIQADRRPGAFCVFSNKVAKVIDILLAVFAAVFIILLLTPLRSTYIIILALSALVWAANMHSLFNGKIYRTTKFNHKERRQL